MTKRKQIVALLVGVLLLAGAAGTFAWLSVTGVLVNEFGFGSVAPSVDEKLDGNVKSNVMITNNGSAPAYLRVVVDIYWQDQNGARCGMNQLPAPTTSLRGAVCPMPQLLAVPRLGFARPTGSTTGRLLLRRSTRRACSSRACPRRRQMVKPSC